jgi:hypothetical protein
MFIVTTIRNQSKLRRSATSSKSLRSYRALDLKESGIYKHFIPTGCVPKFVGSSMKDNMILTILISFSEIFSRNSPNL